jgi:hypothetical protein
MSVEQYESIPKTLSVREMKLKHKIRVTTLCDTELHSKKDISDLYQGLWNIEVDFRNLKITMGMSVLSYKSPEMCEKEIWIYLLASNIIRILMASTAKKFIRKISFKNTLQTWNSVSIIFDNAIENIDRFFFIIAAHQVGKRVGRIEPRARKKRASAYRLLMLPRHHARADILKKGHPPKQRKNTGAKGGKLNAVLFRSLLMLSMNPFAMIVAMNCMLVDLQRVSKLR